MAQAARVMRDGPGQPGRGGQEREEAGAWVWPHPGQGPREGLHPDRVVIKMGVGVLAEAGRPRRNLGAAAEGRPGGEEMWV